MATRRRRNYKAEYAARKQRARAAGYESIREYTAARKRLGTPRRASPVPKRVSEAIIAAGNTRDQAAKAWSNRHSKVKESAWSDSFNESQREAYFNTYVKPSRNRAKWKKSQHDYLVPAFYTEEEYNERYGGTTTASGAA